MNYSVLSILYFTILLHLSTHPPTYLEKGLKDNPNKKVRHVEGKEEDTHGKVDENGQVNIRGGLDIGGAIGGSSGGLMEQRRPAINAKEDEGAQNPIDNVVVVVLLYLYGTIVVLAEGLVEGCTRGVVGVPFRQVGRGGTVIELALNVFVYVYVYFNIYYVTYVYVCNVCMY